MAPRSTAQNIKRLLTVGAFILFFAAAAPPAGAAISSASIDGSVATLNLDDANDVETISVSGDLLVHTDVGGGLVSTADWDSTEKEQTVPADGTVRVVVNGGDGNDRLVGRAGIDVMSGGPGDDTFEWNNGDNSDRLNGDEGADTVEVNGSDGEGDDQVDIRDNAAELASGGAGTDSVTADSADLDVLDGFESVDRPPVITPPPVNPPPPPVEPPPVAEPPPAFLAPPNVALPRPLVIRSTGATARNGRVSIKVSCPAASPVDCTGALVLLTAKRVRIGRTSYNVRRGAFATLKVRLSEESRRLADRRGRLEVLARTSTSVSGAAAQSSRRLTLALRRIDQGRQR